MSTPRQYDESKSTHHHQRLAHSSGLDSNSRETPPIPNRSQVQASPKDIICGRGFHIVNHRGNLNLHLIVNNYRELYLSSTRELKAKIIKRILGEIKSTGARFIRTVSDGNGAEEWQEVDETTAYKKVSHALRLRTKNESNRQNDTIAVADRFHRQRDSNINDAVNQLRSSSIHLRATSVPSATNTAPAHHHRPAITANPTDIICGRGFHISNHGGNLNLHRMVNIYREEYLKSLKSQKPKIIKHIIGEIQSAGARFIRKVSDGQNNDKWEVVDDETAYKKVSHVLRLRTKNETNRENGTMAPTRNFNPHVDSSTGILNQLGNVLPMSTDRPASAPVNVESPQMATAARESTPAAVHSSILNATELYMNATARNGPPVASAAVVQLWAAQRPRAQPMYDDVFRQQYYNVLCSMLQQLAQQHNR